MLRFSTAGESHGEALVALLSGMPAGLAVDLEFVNHELWRRQQGYGRGGRMRIERDTAHILSGVRHGHTIGSPIAMLLANNDWKNWTESLPVEEGDPAKHKRVASPRPGHADLAGAVKYNFSEARYVLERASARESAARVAGGALAKLLLRELGIGFVAYSPLGRGLLTGQLTSIDDLADDDFRRHGPRFQGDNLQHNLDLVARVKDIATAKGCTPGQLAIAWLLAQGDDIVPIPGTKRLRYLDENLGAVDVVLTAADLVAIDAAAPQGGSAGARYADMGSIDR